MRECFLESLLSAVQSCGAPQDITGQGNVPFSILYTLGHYVCVQFPEAQIKSL